jgi:hypothetical protein
MDQRRLQIMIVVGSILFMVIAMASAYLMSISDNGLINRSTASKPLTAESSRENAQMITSSERTVDRPVTPAGTSGQADSSMQEPADGTPESPEDVELTEAEMLIEEATAAADPNAAIAIIEADLDTLAALDQAAEVYTVLGDLYLRSNPENIEVALQQYLWAAETATDAADRHTAILAEVEVRIANDDWDGALARIDAELELSDGPPTVSALRLRLLKGAHAATKGDPKHAETVYGDVMRLSVEGGVIRPEAAEVYRQAGTRLIRLYRQQGRDKDAEAVEREMRRKESLETYFEAG